MQATAPTASCGRVLVEVPLAPETLTLTERILDTGFRVRPDGESRTQTTEGIIPVMLWTKAHRADKRCLFLADRHYNRQKPGTPQFVPPGRCVVLYAPTGALWVTSWPYAEYVKHAWAGAWVNSLFRKECDGLASEYIRDAVAATRSIWPDPPPLGLITFIDPLHVKARKVRGRQAIGESYFAAGFVHVGVMTLKDGLWTFQMTPDRMPEAQPCQEIAS